MIIVIQLFVFDFKVNMSSAERFYKEFRMSEYARVLQKNVADQSVKQIYILCETQDTVDFFKDVINSNKKVLFTIVGHQPTYRELVEFIKETVPKGEIVSLMNADIYFNSQKDHELIRKHLRPNYMFSLTRHEITDESHTIHTLETYPFTGNGGSSDTFIFYTPINTSLDTLKLNFKQNIFGAEAVKHKVWFEAGYKIWNPCDDIITLHLHKDRRHFEHYYQMHEKYTDENSVCNHKTALPPIET